MQISEANQQSRVNERDVVERMLRYAEHLAPGDRDLVRAVYERGLSATEFARASGSSRRFVQGRLRRLITRLNSEAFRFTLQNRSNWPARRRAVATAVILEGRSQREAAALLGLSIHQIRQQLQHVRVTCRCATEREVVGHG